MKWKKVGQIFEVSKKDNFLTTHASNPLAIKKTDSIYRIFYSGRCKENKSSIGWVDYDIDSLKIISECEKNVLSYSQQKDSYFSHGISIGNMYEVGNKKNILFMGWQIRGDDHWRGDIGRISLSNDLNYLHIESNYPFMSTSKEDPISLSYPWVLKDDDGYKMWYGSTIDWSSKNGEMIHVIKYATSNDGYNWDLNGTAIPYELNVAQAFSRPTVYKKNGIYHMWYSFRSGSGEKYRIGCSRSNDGKIWKRVASGIDVSKTSTEWDSEMICYPYVFEHNEKLFMLYNGNNYGFSGFGLATTDIKDIK